MVSRVVAASVAIVLVSPGVALAATPPPPAEPISIGMSPASPRAGSEVRLTGAAGVSSYAWDLDGDGAFDDASGKEVTASFAAGERTVRAQAVTDVGVVTDSRTFTVHEWNVRPGGTVAVKPYTARVGAPVTVSARGSDPDGLAVQTALDVDGDGTFETAGATGTATFATPGERVIRARFTDDAGATSVATTTLEVHTGNIAPTARIAFPAVTPAVSAAAGGWAAEGVDPDGEIVRYEFDVDGDGTFETDRGRDPRIPAGVSGTAPFGVRVTDDSGATAVGRWSWYAELEVPLVVEVGTPAKLSVRRGFTDVTWDADGDGDFDDGTGNEISFTYPAAGTYEVRARATSAYAGQRVLLQTTSARAAADIAVPSASWHSVPAARASVPAHLSWSAFGPNGVEAVADLNGDGAFTDAEPGAMVARWTFDAPTTAALKVIDAFGRAAVTTTEVPFVTGDLGPDAVMQTYKIDTPLEAVYRRTSVSRNASDADDGLRCCLLTAWDADGDGEYDDGPDLDASDPEGRLPASFGLRVTDSAGVSTTLRREILRPVPARVEPPTSGTAPRWLRVSARRPGLAALLRRGITVDVACTRPKCRTSLVVKVDGKTARKLGLRSRTVASRTVSGTRRVTLKLTSKARRALRGVRSVKLTLTAKATAEGGLRSSSTKTLTVRKIADRR